MYVACKSDLGEIRINMDAQQGKCDIYGRTAMVYAAEGGHVEAIAELVRRVKNG